jgi:predicted aldo/keto reductase-like oxidoreductase
MTERELGKSGLKTSSIGLGCMGMSEFYDPKQTNEEESVRDIHRYLDAGGHFLDRCALQRSGDAGGRPVAGHPRETQTATPTAPGEGAHQTDPGRIRRPEHHPPVD